MGRITVFTTNNCLFSGQVRHELNKRNLPFSVINLSEYPERRWDLFLLTRRMTTPQTFFNTRYIGGCDATLQLLEEWDHDRHFKSPLEKYKAQIQRFPDPSNPQLALPEPPQGMEETSSSESSLTTLSPIDDTAVELQLPHGTTMTYGISELTQELSRVLPLASLPYHLVNYNKSVTGEQAVTALMKHYQTETREEAEAIGKQMGKLNIIHHVAYNHAFQDTGKYYYRLQCHQTPHILNSLHLVEAEKRDTVKAEALVESLEAILSTLERECYSFNGGGGIRFSEGIHKKPFRKMEAQICLFQVVDLDTMNHTELLAFGLNVYNIMLKFAFFKYGIPEKERAQEIFMRDLKFNVGGNLYSFSEWLCTISAGKVGNDNGSMTPRRSFDLTLIRASKNFARFNSGDASLSSLSNGARSRNSTRLSLTSPEQSTSADYRIYFATHFFWVRATAIPHFTVANLEKELTMVALAFCAEDCNTEVDTIKGELVLSSVFSLYRKDFCSASSAASELWDSPTASGSCDKELTKIVFNCLENAKKLQLQQLMYSGSKSKVKISFRADDWTANASGKDFLGFDPSSLEANTTRF
jgi:glutaredoxin